MSKSKKIKIESIVNGKRKSTQKLLQEIYAKISEGYTDFEIDASGQHDIGGPLWLKNGNKLKFTVSNPGQRAGSMGMKNTQIMIKGPAPADVGWLNAGAEIIVKGDGGDTTAHCAASGKIFVGGRVGTRSGALMKHDPKYDAPEFWVLKNCGSFSFEFMGGGTAVVCGYDCENLESVLGSRSCVGMVGGTLYVRGKIKDISNEVYLVSLNEGDKEFLKTGLKDFLQKIDKPELYKELSDMSNWQKVIAKTFEERKIRNLKPIRDFRLNTWVEDGIFGDLIREDYYTAQFVETGDLRLKYPEWRNAAYSAPCEFNCPIGIPTQKRISLLRQGKTEEALRLVLDYSPFPASVCGQVCPNLCVDECNRKYVDIPVKTKELGILSKEISADFSETSKTQKVAVIGAGAAGLSCAWHLRKCGYSVEIFESDSSIGGKLRQVIPNDRLNSDILDAELKRIESSGVKINTSTQVDKELFKKLTDDFDAVVAAVGAHNPLIIPVEGKEKFIKGLDFLKSVNKFENPRLGKKVVVLGAGNAGMDVVIGAYKSGAEEVTVIDIQKPSAFEKEIEHAQSLGTKIMWPCFTERVTGEGVYLKDGTLLEADNVIISIGDRPDLSFVESNYLDEKGRIRINEFMQSEANPKVFVPGDVVKLGLFTNAIADGKKAALNIDRMFNNLPLDNFEKAPMIPADRVRNEFYQPLNSRRVMELPAEQESERCMSCGYCRDCSFCLEVCPEGAISRIENEKGEFEYISDDKKCIGCGICAGVCPCGIWTMVDNLAKYDEE